jgi:hypothetical protein
MSGLAGRIFSTWFALFDLVQAESRVEFLAQDWVHGVLMYKTQGPTQCARILLRIRVRSARSVRLSQRFCDQAHGSVGRGEINVLVLHHPETSQDQTYPDGG